MNSSNAVESRSRATIKKYEISRNNDRDEYIAATRNRASSYSTQYYHYHQRQSYHHHSAHGGWISNAFSSLGALEASDAPVREEFLGLGAKVFVCARTQKSVNVAVSEMRKKFGANKVSGIDADITTKKAARKFYSCATNFLAQTRSMFS